jgi:predicted ATPase
LNVLTLEVVAGDAPALSGFRESPPWLDGDGGVCARIFRDGQSRWIDWPALGLFGVSPHSSTIHVWPVDGVHSRILFDFFERRLQPIILQGRGCQTLHASAVEIDSVAVALAGPSGSGKSTLAYALHRHGHAQLADDALVIDMTAEPPVVLALPFAPELRGAARALLDDSDAPAERALRDRSLPLGAIVLLDRSAANQTAPTVEPISGPAACVSVMSHAHVFDSADDERLVTAYARLVNAVPVFRVTYRQDLSDLPNLCAAVRSLIVNVPRGMGSGGR